MDFGKVSNILAVIHDNAADLMGYGYLPDEYWLDFDDILSLCGFVSAGWAELTDLSKIQVEIAWGVLCEVRGLDRSVMYDSPKDFFEAQTVVAEVIPITRGKNA